MIAKGHVEAWQNGVVLRADEVTFNRQTGEAVARGHITLIQPDGQVMFADYAELDRGFRDGSYGEPRALLPQNGRLAANGGRRTNGLIDELSKAVYSTCNCAPRTRRRPPLWQIRARTAVDDERASTHRIHQCRIADVRGAGRLFPVFLPCLAVGQARERAAGAHASASAPTSAPSSPSRIIG